MRRRFPRLKSYVRRKPGEMNTLEAAYAKALDGRKLNGEVADWWFESMKFKLADKTWYTPDFIVVLADGTLQIHETKGFMMEDAAIKLKITSALYWAHEVVLITRKRGTWMYRNVSQNGLGKGRAAEGT